MPSKGKSQPTPKAAGMEVEGLCNIAILAVFTVVLQYSLYRDPLAGRDGPGQLPRVNTETASEVDQSFEGDRTLRRV